MNKIFILPSSLIFIILSSFTSSKVFSQTTRTFTDSGTFTVPAGVTSIIVEAWGGGGGGATRTNNANNGSGGGGGGGAYASSVITVTPGAQYTIVVGAGGAASTKGGDSTFGGAIVKAAGGNGAAIINNNNTSPPGALGGSDVNSIGTTKYPGGNGSKGGDNYGDNSGGGGGGAGSDGPGNHANGINGGDAKPQNGGSGARGVDNPNGTNYTGNNGNTFGGGGSGAKKTTYDDVMGGRGANGLVTLTYTCPTYNLTSTTVTSPLCPSNTATVTLNGNLPVGNYTVTYNQSAPNVATGVTKTMTVTSAGTGTFETNALTGIGATTITITNLKSGSGTGCSNNIGGTNRTATITVAIPTAPTISSITQPNCDLTTGSVVLNDLPSGTWTLTRNDGVKTTGTGPSKTITGLIPGNYTYTVTREDTSCSGSGTGLYAEYFNNRTLTAPAALTRTDATVSFNWGEGSPGSPINNDNFSVRWRGKIQPCYNENYTFSTISDDGIRLWINGVQIINNWTIHPATTNHSTPISLVAGTKYDIVLEYYDGTGGAVAQLFWSSASQPYQIIPRSQLYSEATDCTSTNSTAIVINERPNCWTGAVDSNWNNASNWLQGVPTNGIEATLNTFIPSGLLRYPVIDNGATSGYVKTIVLENNTTITVMDNSLRITENLKLDGKINLEGESQLLQDLGSNLDVTSAGTIQINQQGTRDLYTYNYWSSPVVSNTLNNSYAVAGVLRDGSYAENPRVINFINSGHDGTPGSLSTPIGIAHYWIHKYANKTSNSYNEWVRIRSTGNLKAGEGFTMKGVANTNNNVALEQNYVFVGKPNNGDITLPITAGNDYLVGNPYPSALDADEFILDHIADGGRASQNIINGALYFWDHFGGGSHLLADYQGGYATYTLIGGAVAISNDARINATGISGTKEPTQYIPVAQGFFVSSILDESLIQDELVSPVVGGTITFKNSQRVFETEASGASLFMKSGNTKGKTTASKQVDNRQKIRLMFDSPKGYHRQLLVGVDERASNGFDLGFDAPLIETNKEDMFWIFKNNEFVIQAVDNFDEDQILPLGIKTNQAGISKIKIDGLENISNDFKIYLKDNELGIYHPINESPYEVYLEAGDYLDRFEVTFKSSGTLDVDDVIAQESIQVYFSNHTESIIVHNPVLRQIKSVELVNLLGQSIHKFEGTAQNYMEYKTNQISAGVYIIKVQTPEGSVSKKVLIK